MDIIKTKNQKERKTKEKKKSFKPKFEFKLNKLGKAILGVILLFVVIVGGKVLVDKVTALFPYNKVTYSEDTGIVAFGTFIPTGEDYQYVILPKGEKEWILYVTAGIGEEKVQENLMVLNQKQFDVISDYFSGFIINTEQLAEEIKDIGKFVFNIKLPDDSKTYTIQKIKKNYFLGYTDDTGVFNILGKITSEQLKEVKEKGGGYLVDFTPLLKKTKK